ncbi:TetR/AcrR family transcriptional regulator [Paenibacillus antri]|uniref:TetR/AcrR family transcriptional regulator n=1 Tax=Paenibacillus antri TaxID=2582848 RepID=UPI0013052B85|nr:TetR/AcrR family transcriptional regulator [Paenibacillus antri]
MRKGEATKEHIIEKAAHVLNRRGYYASSLSEIMEASGLKKGGIYNHFESKEQIIAEAFAYNVKAMSERFDEAAAGFSHPIDRVLAMAAVARELYRGEPIPGGCAIMNAAVESDDAYPFLKAQARTSMERFVSKVRAILEQGQRDGRVDPAADAAEAALFIVSAIEGSLMISKLTDSGAAVDAALKRIASFLNRELRRP